jgi:glycosyltransferase involved in cell wall biosynthesis
LKPLLSIIVPIKKIEVERFLILINSIRFLKKSHFIETIIIYGEESPATLLIDNGFSLDDFLIRHLPPKGIYNAFNYGVSISNGKWIMFFGGDDFFLPSFDNLLCELSRNDFQYSAIVCHVVFGNKNIFKPFHSKFGLVFKNWCQQGVIYRDSVFSKIAFDEKYPIQADHKFNIELCSLADSKVLYQNRVISYFNINGISQTLVDKKFRTDFPNIIKINFGIFWGIITYVKRSLSNLIKNHN